jgi:hypothetical protein
LHRAATTSQGPSRGENLGAAAFDFEGRYVASITFEPVRDMDSAFAEAIDSLR